MERKRLISLRDFTVKLDIYSLYILETYELWNWLDFHFIISG